MDLPFAPNAGVGNRWRDAGVPGERLSAVGVISGTSMDGVDVAQLLTDGAGHIERGGGLTVPYAPQVRQALRAALPDAIAAPDAGHRTAAITQAERLVTESHGDAIARFLDASGVQPDLIGWHGQTLAHAPRRGFTMQVGDGEALAARFGRPVVCDFRSADVAAGGEGAPLVPVYHQALVRAAGLAQPALVVNLGGIANLTYVDGEQLRACDTGPASALVDDAMAETGRAYDAGGAVAASGRVDAQALARLMDAAYFARAGAKSLDRNEITGEAVAHLPFADRVATLTRFSAEALAAAVRTMPRTPAVLVACGGGTHNATLMRFIAEATGLVVVTADAAGLSSDFMEAEAFAYLAVRSLRALPLTFPGTTGVPAPLTGGRLVCRPAPSKV